MRSGKLDKFIRIEAYSTDSVDEYGTPIPQWDEIAVMRAQVVQASTEEYFRGYGESEETVIIFRMRYMSEITTEHRIKYNDRYFNIREISEIGRRMGLELRAEAFE